MCELIRTALPSCRQSADHLAELDSRPRVEPGRRFVEHQHAGVVDHRAAEAEPLLHALRETVDWLVGQLVELREIHHIGEGAKPFAATQSVRPAKKSR